MKLTRGRGSPDGGGCWMVAVQQYVEESGWHDHPECVEPIIRRLCIGVNDSIKSDEERERIIGPQLFRPVGTASDNSEHRFRRREILWEALHRWAEVGCESRKSLTPSRLVDLALARAMECRLGLDQENLLLDAMWWIYRTTPSFGERVVRRSEEVFARPGEAVRPAEIVWVKFFDHIEHLMKVIVDLCKVTEPVEEGRVAPVRTKEDVCDIVGSPELKEMACSLTR